MANIYPLFANWGSPSSNSLNRSPEPVISTVELYATISSGPGASSSMY